MPMRKQPDLPFAEAEGSAAELKNMLGIALLKVNANLYVAQLVLWIFNTTAGAGRRDPLKKSYAELAARPWGLCCHPNQAAATVKKARRAGLIVATETWSGPGIQGANEYRIDWQGVRRILGSLPPHTTCDPPHTTCDPPHTTCDPPHTTCEQYKENTDSHHSESESERKRPRMASPSDSEPRKARPVPACCEEVPELAEAIARRIAPLPAADLCYGAFAPLSASHLASGALVPWFRRQLSLREPLTGDSEAELLLVLAAGLAIAAMPDAEVKKSRPAIFAATVSRGLWPKILRFVPAARKLLDRVCAQWPLCLADESGMGQEAPIVTEALS